MTTMTKAECAEILAVAMNVPKSETGPAVGTLFDRIAARLLGGDKIKIDGVGTLVLKPKKGGVGRNPRTGEIIEIPPGRRLHTKIAKSLKDQAAGPPVAKAA